MTLSDASEGDVNTSPHRAEWIARLDAQTRDLLARDEAVFFRRALSTPCLNAIVEAKGLRPDRFQRAPHLRLSWQQRAPGRLWPSAVLRAVGRAEALPFSPRRYTNDWRSNSRAPGRAGADAAGKVLFAPSGAATISDGAETRPPCDRRHKTLSIWDAFHGANLDTISVGGEAIFRHGAGPLLTRAEHSYVDAISRSGDICDVLDVLRFPFV